MPGDDDKKRREWAWRLLIAARREAKRTGWRFLKTADEKKVEEGLARIFHAETVIEQRDAAKVLAAAAEKMAAKFNEAHPVRAFFHRHGFPQPELRAVEEIGRKVTDARDRAAPFADAIERESGGWPKAAARAARALARELPAQRQRAKALAAAIEKAGGNPEQVAALRELARGARRAEKTRDAATVASAVFELRQQLAAHELRAELAAGDGRGLDRADALNDRDARMAAVAAVRERAEALEALADAADRQGDFGRRDALNHAVFELRTAAQGAQMAKTPEAVAAARTEMARAMATAADAEPARPIEAEGAKLTIPRGVVEREITDEAAAAAAARARELWGDLEKRMAKARAGIDRLERRGHAPGGATFDALREELNLRWRGLADGVRDGDDRQIARAWVGAEEFTDDLNRTIAHSDLIAGEGPERGPDRDDEGPERG